MMSAELWSIGMALIKQIMTEATPGKCGHKNLNIISLKSYYVSVWLILKIMSCMR